MGLEVEARHVLQPQPSRPDPTFPRVNRPARRADRPTRPDAHGRQFQFSPKPVITNQDSPFVFIDISVAIVAFAACHIKHLSERDLWNIIGSPKSRN